MTTWQILTSTWDWNPLVLMGCVALVLIYGVALGFHFSKRALFFVSGIILLFLALSSPLNELGHVYLFSAHMVQHVLLLLVVPFLLLLGIPSEVVKRVLVWPPAGSAGGALGWPLLGWFFGVGAMWIWHIPALYNLALHNEAIHMVEQLSLIVMGIIFWWPVNAPSPDMRLSPLISIPYLFSACVACTILGIIITFSSVGLYPTYLHPNDALGILSFIRDGWGISPRIDQQIGGLLMWVPCCILYTFVIMLTLARWYSEPGEDTVAVGNNS
ncbi:MAG: cytochrome c oxidase assembly protein [Ignavibacteriales bacterium]